MVMVLYILRKSFCETSPLDYQMLLVNLNRYGIRGVSYDWFIS